MDNRESVTLVLTPQDLAGSGALGAYLAADDMKSRQRLPGPLADTAIQQFHASLRNVTDRCDRFVNSIAKQQSHLVLGKVQSGKTAHLLGVLAWAADSSARAAIVFTGVTGSLNDQTYDRLGSDLVSLPGSPVEVLYVPTRSQAAAFADFKAALVRLAAARGGVTGSGQPLPVLVAMKNSARVSAANAAFSLLAQEFGPESLLVAVDDESDQASQNAKSRQRRVASTYRALAEIRALPLRNLWLSYTATPQAVLLTDRFGALRPDFVATVAPRFGYFGLEDAMSESFEHQRVEVSDWRQRARAMASCPESLTAAIYRYLYVAWIRTNAPDEFYCDSVLDFDPRARLVSTQMLIHESAMQADHSRMHRLVIDELQRIQSTVKGLVTGQAHSDDAKAYARHMAAVAEDVSRSGAPARQLFRRFISNEGQASLLTLLEDTQVSVINSDSNRPNASQERPVTERDYEKHAAWILIGGDILGRGLTIPQLTVTYFLRSSRTPNFDTVLQQLRFCGYRKDYRKWLSIHAPVQSFQDLRYMAVVDRVVWERASAWDRQDRHIGKAMPKVFYASHTGAQFEPIRASVRDPDITDRQISGGSLFALRDIFDPGDFRSNLMHLRRWTQESGLEPNDTSKEWLRFDDLSVDTLSRLLIGWVGSASEAESLEAVCELFEPELGDLGLSEVPSVVYVSSMLAELWGAPKSLSGRLHEISVTRSVHSPKLRTSLDSWLQSYSTVEHQTPDSRATLNAPHVGGGQRALRDRLNYNAVVFVIEPILGLAISRRRDSAIAIGLGFAALSPVNFEVRTIGHS